MMAMLKVCCVYDSAIEAYLTPFFVPALGAATRLFVDEINREGSDFGRHRGDFELYHISDFDPVSGIFSAVGQERLLRGADVDQGGS